MRFGTNYIRANVDKRNLGETTRRDIKSCHKEMKSANLKTNTAIIGWEWRFTGNSASGSDPILQTIVYHFFSKKNNWSINLFLFYYYNFL